VQRGEKRRIKATEWPMTTMQQLLVVLVMAMIVAIMMVELL
jgi:hypothetical protein